MEWVAAALREAGQAVETGPGFEAAAAWTGAVIDSRAECSGRLFFALTGERTDGHAFVEDALGAGCAAVVISDAGTAEKLDAAGAAYVKVPEVLDALQELGRRYRLALEARVVAITGSAGKTTTKEYLRAILRRRYRVHSNPGNYNNTIGVPLTILEAEPECEYLVSEVGANQAGEIAFLAEMLAPDVGVVTNVGDAHIGLFGSRDAIATEKAALLGGLVEGHAVIPAGREYSDRLRDSAPGRIITFGTSAPADFVVTGVRASDTFGIEFEINGQPFSLSSPGEYNAHNAAAAVAAADVCGIGLPLSSSALADVVPLPGRGRVHRVGGVVLVDESYNASPSSMELSLSMLAAARGGRRVAVLGDMAELGTHSDDEHRRIGRHLAGLGLDQVYWVGASGAVVRSGLGQEKGGPEITVVADVDALAGDLQGELADGDVVLVKASRACGLDRFVSKAIAQLQED
jgi:UDP-N-acetylmuramoyl-tripeptide--D-alanyl-D-alanine ligase